MMRVLGDGGARETQYILVDVLCVEQCDALCEIEESNVHHHLALELLSQENEEGSANGEQCAKMHCG